MPFYAITKKNWLEKCLEGSSLSYTTDTLMIVNFKGKEHADKFQNYLNSKHIIMSYISYTADDQLPLLGCFNDQDRQQALH